MSNIELIAATQEADQRKIENLLQFYMYDFSEWLPISFGQDGKFFIHPKADYWANAGTHAYFISVDGEIAGFATIDTDVVDSDTKFSIGYFFVARRFRATGAGTLAAEMLLQRFPGTWQIYHVNANTGAGAFWKKVVPRLSWGNFSTRVHEIHGYECTLYKFRRDDV